MLAGNCPEKDFLPESQKKMWKYLTTFAVLDLHNIPSPTEKPEARCLASTTTIAVHSSPFSPPPNQAGHGSCLIYGKGFGGDMGSDFEELGQTKTGKLESALQTFMLNLCSFSEENLLHR